MTNMESQLREQPLGHGTGIQCSLCSTTLATFQLVTQQVRILAREKGLRISINEEERTVLKKKMLTNKVCNVRTRKEE